MHFRFEHQAGGLHLCIRLRGTLKPDLLFVVLMQTLRRAGGEQCGKRRRLAGGMGVSGLFHGLGVTSLKQEAHDIEKLIDRFFALASLAKFTHAPGQGDGQGHTAQQGVKRYEAAEDEQDGQVKRYLGTIGGVHQQNVALVEMCGQRDADGQRKERQHPEQAFHLPSLPSLKFLIAERLSLRLGSSMLISVAESCLSVLCADCTDLSRLSK